MKVITKSLEEKHGKSFTQYLPRTSNLICWVDANTLFIQSPEALAQIPTNARLKPGRFDTLTRPNLNSTIAPQPGAQTKFLQCPADYAVYGGAAGGGKSYAIVLDALRGVCDPGFSAVLFRRTYRQLELPGGLIDRARLIYSPLKEGTFNGSKYEWKFPSGAKIVFRHLQHETNIYDYQGSEFTLIAFDELTHFPESAWDYLASRSRAPASAFRPYMRATTNPDADSWVAQLIDWWLDAATGLPLHERAGVLRWFVRIDGETIWANDPDDLDHYDATPRSFTFIPANLSDNPALTEGDPSYLAALQAMHPVERARLLEGNWKIRFSAGKYFQRSWFGVMDEAPPELTRVRFWDIAATDGEVSKQACYTAGILLGYDGTTYYVLDVVAEQFAPDRVFDLMRRTAEADGHDTIVRWERQPAAAGKFLDIQLLELMDGFDATWQTVKGQKSTRALPFARAASNGLVKVISADWNDRYLNWLVAFPDDGKDVTDASSGAFNVIEDLHTDDGEFTASVDTGALWV